MDDFLFEFMIGDRTFDRYEEIYGSFPDWPVGNKFLFYVWYFFCGGWLQTIRFDAYTNGVKETLNAMRELKKKKEEE